jgi:hypothetical protein
MRATMIQERAKNLPNPVFKYDFEKLQSLKKQSGHTLTTLAATTGRSPTTMFLALKGRCPTFDNVYAIVVACGGGWRDWNGLFNEASLLKLNSRVHRAAMSDKSGGGAVDGRSRRGGHGRSNIRLR